MNEIIHSKYARFFFAGLILTILCAWFSMGAYYYDEHFQVLEFCSYKMGTAVPNSYSLPWEFFDKIRPSLLPDIAYVFGKILDWCSLYNPFTLAFLLRLFSGVSAWFIACRFCLLFLPRFKSLKGGKLLVLMSLFLWFIPFLTVRFTVENISGIILLYGIYSILSINEKTKNTFVRYIIAGFLFGIALFIRVQIAFAIAGFAAWLIFINKVNWKYIFVLVLSMIPAIGVNIVLDYWFYGEWTITPYNYYYENIVQHVASDFNTSPWWFYFPEFITNAFSPLSWLLLIMFFVGVYKNLKDPFVWMFIPFFVAHCIIGHKEFRFLFPVTFIFIYIVALGFDYLLYKQSQSKGKKVVPIKNDPVRNIYQKIHVYVYVLSAIICVPLLIYRTVAPVQISMYYNKFLYNHAPAKSTPLFYIPNRNFDMFYDLNTSFYKNPNYNTVLIDSIQQLGDYLRNNKPQSALFFTTVSFGTNVPVQDSDKLNWNGYKIRMLYCFFPPWMLDHNIDNWKEKTPIFRIYQFVPANATSAFDADKVMQDPNTFHSWDAVNSLLSSVHNSLQNGKLDEAEKVLTTIEDKTQGAAVPHLHNYLGMVYMKENRMSDAEKEFNTEIVLNLQKEEAFLNLGILYFRQKDYENAVKSMNSVLGINPNNLDALNNLGVYLSYIKKDYAQAMPYFIKVLSVDPNYEQAYINVMICAENRNNEQLMLKNQRILLDNRNDPYTWVVVQKGMPAGDLRAQGISVSDKLMKKIDSMFL